MTHSLLILIACGIGLLAQSGPAVIGASYVLPTTFNGAPGQLITFNVHGLDRFTNPYNRAMAGADLPTSLSGVSVTLTQLTVGTFLSTQVPILEVHPFSTCGTFNVAVLGCEALTAITAQIPFEVQPSVTYGSLHVAQQGANVGAVTYVNPFSDQVHILTNCDPFLTTADGANPNVTGLPCPSIVSHPDGSLVSATNPANPGEELVAYAVGLGQTSPASVTGQIVTVGAPTQTVFTLDFNYHPNALPSRPLPSGPKPLFAGSSAGYVGLYQINFVVPPLPAGTPPCVVPTILGANVVQSNLTVSVGGQYSFDGARICVAVPNP